MSKLFRRVSDIMLNIVLKTFVFYIGPGFGVSLGKNLPRRSPKICPWDYFWNKIDSEGVPKSIPGDILDVLKVMWGNLTSLNVAVDTGFVFQCLTNGADATTEFTWILQVIL